MSSEEACDSRLRQLKNREIKISEEHNQAGDEQEQETCSVGAMLQLPTQGESCRRAQKERTDANSYVGTVT